MQHCHAMANVGASSAPIVCVTVTAMPKNLSDQDISDEVNGQPPPEPAARTDPVIPCRSARQFGLLPRPSRRTPEPASGRRPGIVTVPSPHAGHRQLRWRWATGRAKPSAPPNAGSGDRHDARAVRTTQQWPGLDLQGGGKPLTSAPQDARLLQRSLPATGASSGTLETPAAGRLGRPLAAFRGLGGVGMPATAWRAAGGRLADRVDGVPSGGILKIPPDGCIDRRAPGAASLGRRPYHRRHRPVRCPPPARRVGARHKRYPMDTVYRKYSALRLAARLQRDAPRSPPVCPGLGTTEASPISLASMT